MLFIKFGVALLIGFLIGMQREHSFNQPDQEHPAGIRTFALMSLAGCGGAFSSAILASPWPFVAVLMVVGISFAVTHYVACQRGLTGLTTEISALLSVLCGALAYWDQLTLAVALGVMTTVILSFKPEMHSFAHKITREDLYATLKFAVITAIVLPVLPNRTFGPAPFNVVNPFTVWLFVVFISGISFIGYVLMKLIGVRKGVGLTGLLGGLASSTALTLSFIQRSRSNPELSRPFALAIIIAWTVMFARVAILVVVINRPLANRILLPLAVPILAGLVCCFFLVNRSGTPEKTDVAFVNPFELWPAFTFAVLFTLILILSKTAQMYLGSKGIYITSLISGLADVDAITLSLTQLSLPKGGLELAQAGRAILLAAAANTLLKGVLVLVTGSQGLRRAILPGFLAITVTTLLVALLV